MRSAASTSAVVTPWPFSSRRQSDRNADSATSRAQGPHDGQSIAAGAEPYPQPLLDPRQVAVMFPIQQGKQGVVVELQGDGPLFGEGGAGRVMARPSRRA